MSARAFFDFRYAFPGYTFILLVFLINLRFVLEKSVLPIIQSNDALTLFGILLGFLTLLSGASMGFLVAQFWYALFNFVLGGHFGLEKCFDMRARPFEKLGKLGIIDDRKTLTTVLDYILSSKREDGIHLYMVRRWDLLNTIGATGIAIVLGLVIGYVTKYFVLSSTSLRWWDILILAFSAALLMCLSLGFHKISEESLLMATFIVEQWEKEKKLRKRVPEQYFGSCKNREGGTTKTK